MPVDYLPIIFFFIALFYSSVGFGGGSSYLAILSLFLTDFYEIRSTALVLNICVVSIGTIMYLKHRVLKIKLIWPFVVSSIPLAFLGAQLKLSQQSFFLILGCALILSALFLLLKYLLKYGETKEFSHPKKLLLGGVAGLISGISGIGGGIFLSPILNIANWANPRIIAALASVFILVNSVGGLAGLQVAGTFQINLDLILLLIVAVVLGGMLGSYLSSRRFNLRFMGILTAILVFYVGLRLILMHGFGVRI